MWTALLIGYFLSWALIPRILLAKKRPVSALAWTWSIILFPYLGPLSYFLFGVERMTRKRLKLRAEFGLSKLGDPGLDEDARQVAALIEKLSSEERRTMNALSRVNELAPSTADEIQLLTSDKRSNHALRKTFMCLLQSGAETRRSPLCHAPWTRAKLEPLIRLRWRGIFPSPAGRPPPIFEFRELSSR